MRARSPTSISLSPTWLTRFSPPRYIYEPWTAPLAVQKEAGCIIGTDYPAPVVKHDEASKANMTKMAAAYAAHNAAHGKGAAAAAAGDAGDDDGGGGGKKAKKAKK